jgi:hypothetical protein
MRGISALLAGGLSLIAVGGAAAEQPLCVYHNRSYSDGAHICIQRQLMMACGIEGERAIWKIVEDRRLAERCAAPLAPERVARWERPAARWPAPRRQTLAAPAKVQGSGKCFTFMGRRFCE